jgi:hypothetical protein
MAAAMDAAQFQQVEQLCRALYEGTDAAERTRAHQVLLPLVNSGAQHVPQLQFLLATSSSPHTLIFASTGLLKLLTNNWIQLPDTQKMG